MLQRITLLTAFTVAAIFTAYGQTKTIQTKPATSPVKPQAITMQQAPPPPPPALPAMKKLNDKLEYALVVDKKTSPNPKEGDVIKLHMTSACNNRLMYSSMQSNKGKPVEFSVNKPTFKSDIINAIMLMTPGDSMVCSADASDIFTNIKKPLPDFVKKGDKMIYYLKLISIKTAADVQKEQQANFQKQMKEQMAKQQAEMKKQNAADDKKLAAYFTKNGLVPTKSATGVYYTITQNGEGPTPKKNDKVKVKYTVKQLDGKIIESTLDSNGKEKPAFEFYVGNRGITSGADELISYMNKGSKGTAYVPSSMAYGKGGSPANPLRSSKAVAPNTILIYEMEVVDIEVPKDEDAAIQKYFKEKGITGAQKTSSGMYYLITKESEGEQPKVNDKVVMNYTGYHLDGTKFDSNVDTAFHHVSPFEFELGKGMVIKGWDEGVALLKKGTKATFFIPSNLAYGSSPRPNIPAFSTLLFDVELVDIKKP